MEIWVNPACSKCQAATATLDEAGIAYTVRRYLDDPPTVEELSAVLDRLGLEPVLDLGLRLGEGSGACLAHSVVDAAARILGEMATFDAARVSEKAPG